MEPRWVEASFWLPGRVPEPKLGHEGQLPEKLSSEDIICVLINKCIEGNIPMVMNLTKLLDSKGKSVEDAMRDIGAPWNELIGPLHMSAAYGEENMCAYLIEALKLDVNATDIYGRSPLYAAIQGLDSMAVIKILLISGADPNLPTNTRMTSLHIATRRGKYEIAELLLNNGAEVDAVSANGETPLHIAVKNGDKRILELLLRHSADVSKPMSLFYSPILMAITSSSLDCLNLLIKAGADVNGIEHITPLMIAAVSGKDDIIKILLAAGADPNVHDQNGELPVTLAAKAGWRKCIEMLLPYTTPLDKITKWTVEGLLEYGKHTGLKHDPTELIRFFFEEKGDNASQEKNYADAFALYTVAIEIDPDYSTLYGKRCTCSLHMGESYKALCDSKLYKNMQSSTFSTPYYLEGASLLLTAENEKALEMLLVGLKMDFGKKRTFGNMMLTDQISFEDSSPSSTTTDGNSLYRPSKALSFLSSCHRSTGKFIKTMIPKGQTAIAQLGVGVSFLGNSLHDVQGQVSQYGKFFHHVGDFQKEAGTSLPRPIQAIKHYSTELHHITSGLDRTMCHGGTALKYLGHTLQRVHPRAQTGGPEPSQKQVEHVIVKNIEEAEAVLNEWKLDGSLIRVDVPEDMSAADAVEIYHFFTSLTSGGIELVQDSETIRKKVGAPCSSDWYVVGPS